MLNDNNIAKTDSMKLQKTDNAIVALFPKRGDSP
jgi:hypothetical protein